MSRPVLPLKLVESRLTAEPKHAVYVECIFEDAAGKRWTTHFSEFMFDLDLVDPAHVGNAAEEDGA